MSLKYHSVCGLSKRENGAKNRMGVIIPEKNIISLLQFPKTDTFFSRNMGRLLSITLFQLLFLPLIVVKRTEKVMIKLSPLGSGFWRNLLCRERNSSAQHPDINTALEFH